MTTHASKRDSRVILGHFELGIMTTGYAHKQEINWHNDTRVCGYDPTDLLTPTGMHTRLRGIEQSTKVGISTALRTSMGEPRIITSHFPP
jgi:hypothetical protein